MRVVYDASVVVAGLAFRGEAWGCLVRLARRQVVAFGTEFTLEETRETVLRLARYRKLSHDVGGALTWYLSKVRLVEPAPLGKQRSRDPQDDPYLSAALSARALVVTYDHDLLDLGKPFGIEILRPSNFLRRFQI